MKKKYLFGISFLLMVLLIIFANGFIMEVIVDSEFRIKKINMNDLETCQDVFFDIENYEYMGGIYELFCIEGWAFCETIDSNNENIIGIVLTNGNETYYSKGALLGRSDVYYEFEGSYDVNGIMHGFVNQFATYSIPIGEYDIYLYVYENDQSYGVVDTGYVFYKEKETIQVKESIS